MELTEEELAIVRKAFLCEKYPYKGVWHVKECSAVQHWQHPEIPCDCIVGKATAILWRK